MHRTSAILVLVALLACCLPRFAAAAAADFTLFYSGGVGGELDPCG